MERTVQKRKPESATRDLDELHATLIALYDDFTETTAWTAFVLDGICAVLADSPSTVDPQTQIGLRLASILLKQRIRKHAMTLRSTCDRLRAIRTTGRSRRT